MTILIHTNHSVWNSSYTKARAAARSIEFGEKGTLTRFAVLSQRIFVELLKPNQI